MKHLLFAAVLFAGAVDAQDVDPPVSHPNFLKGSEDGWFWYKDPKDAPPTKPKLPAPEAVKHRDPPAPTEAAKVEPPKPAGPAPFSVAWLRANMPRLQEAAIDNPTKENISAYYYAQRITMDKAQNYADKAQQVVAADPFLDENNRVPLASFASAQFQRGASKGKDDALKSIAGKGGLWVFYDSKCDFCGPQVNTVQEVAKKYGFPTKFIAMDGNGIKGLLPEGTWVKESGQAKMLKISLTPTTIYASPPNNFFVISQGLMSQDGLADRLILAAQSNDLLPPEILAGVQKYQRGLLKPEDMTDGASDDPKVWIEKLKERLQGRY